MVRILEEDFTLDMLKDYLRKDVADVVDNHDNYIITYSPASAEAFHSLGFDQEYMGIRCECRNLMVPLYGCYNYTISHSKYL